MKKLLFLVMLLPYCYSIVAAQTFDLPATTPYNYPSTPLVNDADHVSCYSLGDMIVETSTGNNLYVYGFDGIANNNGIAWVRRNITDATVLNQGFISMPNCRDIEVSIVSSSTLGNLVFVSYYSSVAPAGFYYDIYTWGLTGLSIYSSRNLLTLSTSYRRISMDAHNGYGIAIAWKDISDIKIKTIFIDGFGAIITGTTKTVTNSITDFGNIPDVAISHATGLNVRIVYATPAGRIKTMYETFTNLMSSGTSITFTLEDDIAGIPTGGHSLHIDCPDHGPLGTISDTWAYVYTVDDLTIRSRIKNGTTSSPPSNIIVSGALGIRNERPTLAFSYAGTSIHYGWANYPITTAARYLAVERGINGSYITSAGTSTIDPSIYKYVDLYTHNIVSPRAISFSRQNDRTSKLASVHMIHDLINKPDLRLTPWTSTVFRPGPSDMQAFPQFSNNLSVIPNPFNNKLEVHNENIDGNIKYSIIITNIAGKECFKAFGDLKSVNSELNNFAQISNAGIYFINIKADDLNQTFKIVKAN